MLVLLLPLSLSLHLHPASVRKQAHHSSIRFNTFGLRMGDAIYALCEVDDTWKTTSSGLRYLDEAVGSGEVNLALRDTIEHASLSRPALLTDAPIERGSPVGA